jgi:hypothetical protein
LFAMGFGRGAAKTAPLQDKTPRFSCAFHKEVPSSTVCAQPGIDFPLRRFCS